MFQIRNIYTHDARPELVGTERWRAFLITALPRVDLRLHHACLIKLLQ